MRFPYIRHLTAAVVFGQAICLLAVLGSPELLVRILLIPELALGGEWWRFFTFVFLPIDTHPFWAAFALYFFYLMGTSLEAEWGGPRYNAYMGLGWAFTVLFALLNPGYPMGNVHIIGSVFLAFAYLFPDYMIYLFFVLPVRIKYVAMAVWAFYAWSFATGGTAARLAVLASTANFLVFFARDIALRIRGAHGHMTAQTRVIRSAAEAFHRCVTCGVTELKDRHLEFRVCTVCPGGAEYCREHLAGHAHARVAPEAAS